MKYEYLTDFSFLKSFDNLREKSQFVKITVLDNLDRPIQEIQGRVTSGQININAESSVRRTANISFIADDNMYNILDVNNLISINKRIELEIGVKNTSKSPKYKQYNILWFPMGIYIIISPTINSSSNGINISLQLKDKMVLLNGECGGVIPIGQDVDIVRTTLPDGTEQEEKISIYQTIQELVSHDGQIPLGKILISDLDTTAPYVYYRKVDSTKDIWLIENYEIYGGNYPVYTKYKNLAEQYNGKKIDICQDMGFKYETFVYTKSDNAEDNGLSVQAGDTVSSVLDKIVQKLGNYEYFFDLDGNFRFQEIKNYLNTSLSTVIIDKQNGSFTTQYDVDRLGNGSIYNFNDSNIITSFSNAPQYNMIKNDFMVWGIKKSLNGDKDDIPIYYHLAIDKIPQIGREHMVIYYTDPADKLVKAYIPLIFDGEYAFPAQGITGIVYFSEETQKAYYWWKNLQEYKEIKGYTLNTIKSKDYREEMYLQNAETKALGAGQNYYAPELTEEFPKQYDLRKHRFKQEVVDNPVNLNYYLDIIDSPSLSLLSVDSIGRRTKVINDDDVNCIFAPEIPQYVLIDKHSSTIDEEKAVADKKNMKIAFLGDGVPDEISLSRGHKAAYDVVKSNLNEYLSYNEQITIQALPIYYLEPNNRITVTDLKSCIQGDYIIKSISIPLDTSGLMTISARRATQRY